MPRHVVSAFAIGLAGLHLSPSPASAAACSGNFVFVGPQTDLAGRTRKNTPCTFVYGKRSDINGYQVMQKPAHGTIGSAGYRGTALLTAYKPDTGYTGDDDFTLGIDYVVRRTGAARSTVVHVHMTVDP
jgi:hypothetical protein